MADIQSTQDLYTQAQNQMQALDPSLTDFNEGSILDIVTGVLANLVGEAQRTAVTEFAKTFVNTANGPEVTGGPDDLQTLLVDHFGTDFARPAATAAIGNVTFSRLALAAGNVSILTGTVVETQPDASGVSQSFATTVDAVLTGLSVSVPVQAATEGLATTVAPNTITVVSTSLTDQTVTVTNPLATTGGADAATDAEYRAFALNLFVTLRGATLDAIQAQALTVPGVSQAVPVEQIQKVIQWNDATSQPIGTWFKICRNILYICNSAGAAPAALVLAVQNAVETVRAAGVQVQVVAAQAITQDIYYSVVLNGAGPNFATLNADLSTLTTDVRNYVLGLPIGTGFVRQTCINSIMATWGPAGSNDLQSFTLSVPTAEIGILPNQTLIPGLVKAV